MHNKTKGIELFESNLFIHCFKEKTGTLSIATNNNKSCQIVINNGEIIAVTMSRLMGIEAIKELLKIGFTRASFSQDLELPFKEEARIISSISLLESLGYNLNN